MTGRKSRIKTSDGTLLENWNAVWKMLHRSDVKALSAAAGKIKRLDQKSGFIDDDYTRLGTLSPNVEQIISHCDVMRRLCLKAHDTHFLNHFERLSLLYVFGHLGKEGETILHRIMKKTLNYSSKTTNYFIDKCPKSPVGCSKLRNELVGLGCKSCHCNFAIPKGCYSSPVLHAIDKETYGVEDKNITLPVIKDGKTETVIEYYDSKNQLEQSVKAIIQYSEEIRQLEEKKETEKMKLLDLLFESGCTQIKTPYGVLSIGEDTKLTITLT